MSVTDNKDELFKMNDYTNWENALKACKRNGSYLFGNITSRADAGNKINGSNVKDKTTFWHWLGIARKIYLTTDTGKNLLIITIRFLALTFVYRYTMPASCCKFIRVIYGNERCIHGCFRSTNHKLAFFNTLNKIRISEVGLTNYVVLDC